MALERYAERIARRDALVLEVGEGRCGAIWALRAEWAQDLRNQCKDWGASTGEAPAHYACITATKLAWASRSLRGSHLDVLVLALKHQYVEACGKSWDALQAAAGGGQAPP
eukprot:1206942-Alexandrium_andersonii.AAC.1